MSLVALPSFAPKRQVPLPGVRVSTARVTCKRYTLRIPHAVADTSDQDVTLEFGVHQCGVNDIEQSRLEDSSDGLASATWVFTGVQPRHTLREVLTRGPPSVPGGRAGGWLALASIVLALVKGAHWSVKRRCKGCKTCRGYGVKRCTLCGASGAISWKGKWDHVEPCPACVGKRFTNCPDCGGLYHKPVFQHLSRNAGLQASQEPALSTVDVISPLVD